MAQGPGSGPRKGVEIELLGLFRWVTSSKRHFPLHCMEKWHQLPPVFQDSTGFAGQGWIYTRFSIKVTAAVSVVV